MAVEVIDKIKPKNNGNFALMDAADVEMPDGTRLDDTVKKLQEDMTGAGVVVSDVPPEDKRVLWIDPSDKNQDSTMSLAQARGEIDALLGGDE